MNQTGWSSLRAITATVALVVALAGCARVVSGQGSRAAGASAARPSFPSQSAAPSPSPTAASTTPSSGTLAGCPTITDATTRLQFRCLTTAMTNERAAGYNTNIVKVVEANPKWYLAEATLVFDAVNADQLRTGVENQLSSFVESFFPAGSTGAGDGSHVIAVSGKPAIMISGTVTIDKSDPQFATLKSKTDRLVALGVLRGDGTAALLIQDVPDVAKALWPAMVTVATSARLV